MARKGRRRNTMARRTKNGRLTTTPPAERPADIMAVALNAPHRRGMAEPEDRRAENPIGRLRLAKLITGEQYAAALRWAGIVARMHRAIEAPSPHPRSLDAIMVGGGRSIREIDADEYREAWEAYDAAYTGMLDHAPMVLHRAVGEVVNAVVIAERDHPNLDMLRLGLDGLVAHFGRECRVVPLRAPMLVYVA